LWGQFYFFRQKIRQITINDNSVGRNVDEVLRIVEAYQYADEHGEVCPVGWKRGCKLFFLFFIFYFFLFFALCVSYFFFHHYLLNLNLGIDIYTHMFVYVCINIII